MQNTAIRNRTMKSFLEFIFLLCACGAFVSLLELFMR